MMLAIHLVRLPNRIGCPVLSFLHRSLLLLCLQYLLLSLLLLLLLLLLM